MPDRGSSLDFNKIFGIGLSRTGTTSFTHFLREEGIKCVHYPSPVELENFKPVAACDITVAFQFERLDGKYPRSLFVHTVREKEDWMESMRKYMSPDRSHKADPKGWRREVRLAMYGSLLFDADIYSEAYDKHYKRVDDYFKGRERDLLTLDIIGGDKPDKLMNFLNLNFLNLNSEEPFPMENKLSD